jgi:hypothetical protein
MLRVTKTAITAILALSIAALPTMLDQCAETCDAHQATAAVTPPCHHAVATGTHLTTAPAACGHDHTSSAFTASKSFAPSDRAFALTAILGSTTAFAPRPFANLRFEPHAPPDSSPPLFGRSLPLRV